MALTKVSSSLVSDSAVTSGKIADGGVATADIATNAVTSTKIAQNSILTKHIDDGQVTTDQLGADAVTAAKIADNAVSEEHLDITVITSLTAVTAATGDLLMVADVSDSNNLKKIPVSSILAGTHTGAVNTSGTINAGAITSSGNVVLDAAGHNYIELHSATANTRKWRFFNGQSWNPDALLIYDVDADATVLTIETGKLGINRGAGSLSHTLDVGGNIAISGTEIISSSRNFTNIGTISSGAITSTGNINLGDNNKAIFGAGSDLQIYHDGSNSIISDEGTGGIKIFTAGVATSGFYKIGGEELATFEPDGPVTLYHNDVAKLATASGGVTVTGSVDAAPNTDSVSVFGRTAIGFVSGLSDFAFLGHYDRQSSSDYGFVQSSAGATYLNAASGQSVNLQIGGSRKVVLDASGKVGIGTTGPASKLHVYSAAATSAPKDTYAVGLFDDTEGRIQVRATNSGSDGAVVGLSTGSHNWGLMATAAGTFSNAFAIGYVDTSTDGNVFGVDSMSEKLIITTSGNVGIGTTSPDEKLHVDGQAVFEGAGNTNRGNIIMGAHGSGSAKWATLAATHYNDASTGSAGNMLIGGYSSETTNQVYIGGGPYELNPATHIRFYTHSATTHNLGGTEKLTIDSAGDIIIGSTSKIYSSGDTDSYLQFNQANTLRAVIGDSTRMIINTSETVFNEDSGNFDFRIEGDDVSSLFHVNAGANVIQIGQSSYDVATNLESRMRNDRHDIGARSYGAVSGSGQPARWVSGSVAVNTTSAGSQLQIPCTSQVNLWRPFILKIIGVTAEYNYSSGNKGFEVVMSGSLLSSVNALTEIRKSGNVASIAASGMDIHINFTNAYNAGLSDYEGLILHYELMSITPAYVKMWQAVLN